jgi:hypothetical protein
LPAYINKNLLIERYYQNGYLHRILGPAIISQLELRWYQNDYLHRIDGPAIEYVKPMPNPLCFESYAYTGKYFIQGSQIEPF